MGLGDEMRALAHYEFALEVQARRCKPRRRRSGDCAFCGKFGADLVVDHDHATGRIRGLVHIACNRIIGSHTRETTQQLAQYLNRDVDLGRYPRVDPSR